MITITTNRMIMKTNLPLENRDLKFSMNTDEPIDILNLKPSRCEDTGFAFYDRNNDDSLICHIGITSKRHPNEITYGTESEYRRQGYMQEALQAFVSWIFDNTNIDELKALIVNNPESEHILKKLGFVQLSDLCDGNNLWYHRSKLN